MSKILIIDDDAMTRLLLSELMKKQGYEVVLSASGKDGLETAKLVNPDLVITDYNMPDISGLDVVGELSRYQPGLPVIVLTAYGDVPLTIKSIQTGAYDFIEKPIQAKLLIETVKNGLQTYKLRKSIQKPLSSAARLAIQETIPVGKTPVMRFIFKNIGRISMNRFNVFITGETGVGKEKLARLIHYSGITRDYPMIVVNCKEMHEEQLEMIIFGYSRGSGVKSKTEREGKIEMAGEGTIFFDEISALPERIQLQLLSCIQQQYYYKPGSDEAIPIKARIISSSTLPPGELLNNGLLLKELFFHLNVIHIHVPPLRERKEDIPELVEQIIKSQNWKIDKQIQKVEDGIFDLLKKHDWPGNIRELENTILQAMLLSRGDMLEKQHIHIYTSNNQGITITRKELLLPLDEMEKRHISAVLQATGWRKQETAKILKITRPTLNAKIEKYQLRPEK